MWASRSVPDSPDRVNRMPVLDMILIALAGVAAGAINAIVGRAH